ncbi:MAG: molybdopterin-dependent oxidoreductase [Anaerolineae bacterium]|nr:molybdopterin-dependent oxidoreductase [Anaerolineae bacterium]
MRCVNFASFLRFLSGGLLLVALVWLAGGCSVPVTPSPESASAMPSTENAPATPTAVADVAATPASALAIPSCPLTPVIPPTPPAVIPGYTELDTTTQLHVTGKIPELDFATYRLFITGMVSTSLSLTYDELRCLPKREVTALLICPGFFEDEATWAGTPLYPLLERAGIQPGATRLRLRSADGFSTLVDLDAVRGLDNILAYEWEGEPLPLLHGFPLRTVLPKEMGDAWIKWLVEIAVE